MKTHTDILLHYFRNADHPQLMADKVLAAIQTLGNKYVGHPNSTFVFKRSEGMFRSEVAK